MEKYAISFSALRAMHRDFVREGGVILRPPPGLRKIEETSLKNPLQFLRKGKDIKNLQEKTRSYIDSKLNKKQMLRKEKMRESILDGMFSRLVSRSVGFSYPTQKVIYVSRGFSPKQVFLHELGHIKDFKNFKNLKNIEPPGLSGWSPSAREALVRGKMDLQAEIGANIAAMNLIKKYESPKYLRKSLRDYKGGVAGIGFKSHKITQLSEILHELGVPIKTKETVLGKGMAIPQKMFFNPTIKEKGRTKLREILKEVPEFRSKY